MFGLFRKKSKEPARPVLDGKPSSVPDGVLVYAIGDVHGRADLLRKMLEQIVQDFEARSGIEQIFVIFLGDYIDRGMDSRPVIETVRLWEHPRANKICLIGNHDAWLMGFLEDVTLGRSWIQHGGDATLSSYGVRMTLGTSDDDLVERYQQQLRTNLPDNHLDFFENLQMSFTLGDYFFVHAGIRPGLSIDDQAPEDLLWIREPFISTSMPFEKIIVHGHTPEEHPVVRSNRIGVDTGACFTGALTALVLEQDTFRFLSTANKPQNGETM